MLTGVAKRNFFSIIDVNYSFTDPNSLCSSQLDFTTVVQRTCNSQPASLTVTPLDKATVIQLWGIHLDFKIQTLPDIGSLFQATASNERQSGYTQGAPINAGDTVTDPDGVIFWVAPNALSSAATTTSFSFISTDDVTPSTSTNMVIDLKNFIGGDNITPPPGPDNTTIYITVGAVLGLLLILVLILLVIFIVVRKRKQDKEKGEQTGVEMKPVGLERVGLPSDGSFKTFPLKNKSGSESWEIDSQELVIDEEIGEGGKCLLLCLLLTFSFWTSL